jgi:uncharacterized protein (TIGR03435 family)
MKPVWLVLLSCAAFAQTPAFDVADVHASKPGTSQDGDFLPGGRLELHGFTMLDLITYAYGVDGDLVFGGPPWLSTDRFDVTAKTAGSTSDEGAKLMLRSLLADRFKLTIHTEDRPLPVYLLTVGKKLLIKKAGKDDGDCDRKIERPWLTFTCKNLTMKELAERVTGWANNYLDHPVVDQTGLQGGYDFTLRWTGKGALVNTPDGIAFFDAVEKQLGLKLVAGKHPLPAMVVDSVNQTPTPNAPGVIENLPVTATEFEVADLKPSRPDEKENARILPTGRIDLEAFPLKQMIMFAYDIHDEATLIGPKWLESAKFDLHANAGSAVSMDALHVMMKSLLADRFKLAVHTEQQPVQVYVLLAGKRPKIEPAAGKVRAGCKRSVPDKLIVYECKSTTMAQFAEQIHQTAGGYLGEHPMVDATEMTGSYDFTLTWTPVRGLPAGMAKNGESSAAGVPVEPGGITLFEAIDRQLGLKVELQKKPMAVLVIDQVNQVPTAN